MGCFWPRPIPALEALTCGFPSAGDMWLAAQASKEIVLRQWRAGGVGCPNETLVAERVLGDVRRDFAEPRFLDLTGMREQRITLAGQHRPDVNCRGDASLGLGHLGTHLRGHIARPGHVFPELS